MVSQVKLVTNTLVGSVTLGPPSALAPRGGPRVRVGAVAGRAGADSPTSSSSSPPLASGLRSSRHRMERPLSSNEG